MLNNVVIMGRLVHEPELKYSDGGGAYLKARIACKRNRKNENGEYPSDFFTVLLWKQSAEYVANYCSKGDAVIVTGRLVQSQWTDKDGNRRETLEISAFTVERASGRAQGENGAKGAPDPRYDGLTPADDAYDPFAEEM